MFRRLADPCRRAAAGAFALGVLALAAASPSAAASLEAVRVGAHPDFTRLVLDTSHSLAPAISRPAPTTLHLDLAAAPDPVPDGALAPPAEGLIARIAVTATAGGSRLEVALAEPARVKAAFALAPGDGRWHRYVVDLEPDPDRKSTRLNSSHYS